MDFQCNVCGTDVVGIPIDQIDRETPSCRQCGSTVRFRSIVHLVSLTLFGRSIMLPEFPAMPELTGIGLSDWDGYAGPLAGKMNFTNTFLHQEPSLNICTPVGERAASCDFIISSEVFDHVPPPAQVAFQHAFDLLKPGGTLILTVPFTNKEQTQEHFPDLHEFALVKFTDEYVLVNRTMDGRYAVHDKLIFHGGPGSTLEMRVFSRVSLLRHLIGAGFSDIHFFDENVPQFGILIKRPTGLPILAKRPK